jgi:hypothetical protein
MMDHVAVFSHVSDTKNGLGLIRAMMPAHPQNAVLGEPCILHLVLS